VKSSLKLSVLVLAASFVVSACGEVVGTGEQVPIPDVRIDCRSNRCLNNESPAIFVYVTASSCNPVFLNGSEISTSTLQITCSPGSGCFGTMPSTWIGRDHTSTQTVPSGTYTVCAYITYDRLDPITSARFSKAELMSVAITSGRGPIIIETGWQDN
jgi:predicted small secreted protein